MSLVKLDILEKTLDKKTKEKVSVVDFLGEMPVIEAGKRFQFEVGKWVGDTITELTFSNFRPNMGSCDPADDLPVKYGKKVRGKDGRYSWTLTKKGSKRGDGKWRTGYITLTGVSKKAKRRFIEFTLTMKLEDGTCVAVDPPLDERRPKR